jgi:AraC-like DNA-binding protein
LLNINNYSVKLAANEVWYNSQSQFSREYKRYYGYAPVKEWK